MQTKVTHNKQKEERLNIRASARQKEIIAKAASIEEKTISECVLDNAYKAAQEVLAEQTHFNLPEDQWKAFCAALDAPPKSIPELRALLTEPSVFDE
jgi:uncharacterized protein (DUF1778 family)